MAKKTNAKLLSLASVYGVPIDKIESDPALKYVESRALIEVTNYAGLLPNETPELKEKRGEMTYSGNPTSLSNHIKSFSQDCKGLGAWDVIFKTFKSLDLSTSNEENIELVREEEPPSLNEVISSLHHEDTSETELEDETPNQVIPSKEETDVEDTTVKSEVASTVIHPLPDDVHNNKNNIKEDMNMSEVRPEEQNNMNLDELEKSLVEGDQTGKDVVQTDASMPANVNMDEALDAARVNVQKNFESRVAFSKNATVTGLYNKRPPMAAVLANGTDTKGTFESLSDVQSQFSSFCKKVEAIENGDGTVTFKKVPVANIGQAQKMYETFKAALSNPTMELDIFFSKSKGSWAVVGLKEPDSQAVTYLTRENLVDKLIADSLGVVQVALGGQIRLVEATRRANRKSKNQRNAASKKKSEFVGVVSPRCTDRTVMEKAATIYEVIDDQVETKKGPKSVLCCQYYTGDTHTDKDNNIVQDTRTFRITLTAKQHKLAIKRPELTKFASATAVGAVINPIDLQNQKGIDEAFAGISAVIAKVSAKGGETKNETIKSVRAGIEASNAQKVANQAEQLGDLGL